MRYYSNLPQPDLIGFILRHPPKQMLGGHDGPSDPDFEPECTYWTHDEGAILYAVMGNGWHMHGRRAADIGARFGWTSKIINLATNGTVDAVDPHFAVRERLIRFHENTGNCWPHGWIFPVTSRDYMESHAADGVHAVVIDGNHDSPEPLRDAMNAAELGGPDLIVMLHDFWGRPVQDGVTFLQQQGFRTRIYNTPNGVALCWRGFEGWAPPDHVPDPAVDWAGMRARVEEFDWSKCE